ncbi:apolipoprotein N-acyltransferase [Chthonobacter albigriseus]|uniref:apolipoprotein N-acyltransferase n=1 Tax=Chthonobacter albigriseus TaxID=1683161 RepID=UPI0015EFBCC0|nr:apolipoprotein N-acyltransferase [Chthonobacter albigriseus]
MRSVADAVILSWGWRRFLVAFVAGALSALSLAPIHAAPILLLTIPVLVLLLDGAIAPAAHGVRRARPAAAVGWWFGFGYFLAGLWWVGAAFLVDAEAFGWMMPFAVVALPAGLALFFAFGTLIARFLWVESPMRIFALAVGLTTAEWLRGHVLTGFPWNLLGQAAGFTDVTAQAASVVGVYGLTALTLVVAAAPVVLLDAPRRRWTRQAALGIAALLLAADVGYGVLRLAHAGAPGDAVIPDMRVRIVQPAIAQSLKWDPDEAKKTLDTLVELSDLKTGPETLGAISFTHIIWPETAVPFFLTEEPQALSQIGDMLPVGTTLITGAPRVVPGGDGAKQYFNSVYVVDDRGRIVDAYDKAHLVPFGEYLPMEDVLGRIGLKQLVQSVGGFSSGPGLRTLVIPGAIKVGFLICYEIIFPGAATAAEDRPSILINVTNDGWFGATSGPYQHLDQARLRAIEEGIPVLRAANTGISAVVDPYGRVVAQEGLGNRGTVDSTVPSPILATVFSDYGSYFLLTFYLFSAIFIAAGARK